ncbi:MAG: bifunctional DNA primase/polymerase [Candidatus Cybelea sp.]
MLGSARVSTGFLIRCAEWNIENGMAVYPVGDKKRALVKAWNGAGAARDMETVERYWRQFPEAQLGVAVRPSHLVAIDVDPRNGGDASWRKLTDEVGLETFAGCPTDSTPSGGFHTIFRAPDRAVRQGTSLLGPGIDVITKGGIVVPPSQWIEGKPYAWRASNGWLEEFDPPVLPDCLITRIGTLAANRVQQGMPNVISKGERNHWLMRFAYRLRWHYACTEDTLCATLLALNQERCKPPLEENQIMEIAHSVAKRPAASIDPIDWLLDWLPVLGLHEAKIAGAWVEMCELSVGPFTPSALAIENETGIASTHYSAARAKMVKRGAVRVEPRGKKNSPLAPIIVLLPRAKPTSEVLIQNRS